MNDQQFRLFDNQNVSNIQNETSAEKLTSSSEPPWDEDSVAKSTVQPPVQPPVQNSVQNSGSDVSDFPENTEDKTVSTVSKVPTVPEDLAGKRVFVVDAYGLVYQVFHALPPMFGKDGEIVNAVFGFIRDLFLILEHQKPDLLFCAFDLHAPTFRAKMFSEYKATREKMPDELISQIPRIREILELLRIPVLAMEGFEADDILATMAQRVPEHGGKCFLVTSDKDSRQLIADDVSIFSLRRNLYLDRQFLMEDWGIAPEQVVDYQALVGDSSDNVPGIALIGPKVAKELLTRFGSLEEILKNENLDAFFGTKMTKRKENLLNGKETARLCQTLVRLVRNVPIDVDWEAGCVRNFDFAAVRPIFTQYAFRSMMLKAEALERTYSCRENKNTQYSILEADERNESDAETAQSTFSRDDSELPTVFQDSIQNRVTIPVFDGRFESESGLNAPRLILPPALFSDENFEFIKQNLKQTSEGKDVKKCAETQANVQLSLFLNEDSNDENADGSERASTQDTDEGTRLLDFITKNQKLLSDPAVVKVGFDLKKLRNQLRRVGFALCGPQFDVMIASYILEPDGPHSSLQDLAVAFPEEAKKAETPEVSALLQYLSDAPATEEKKKGRKSVKMLCAADLEAFQTPFLELLFQTFLQKLCAERLDTVCFGLEFPLMEVLAEMEFWGIFVKPERLKEISEQFQSRIDALRSTLFDLVENAGGATKESSELNLNSPIQLRKILFETLGLPVLHKTKTGPSTDAQTLEELALQHEFPAKLLEYRQMMKLQNTYLEALPKLIQPQDHRIHTTFNQAVTATGRLSSSDPNLQNIPVRTEEGKMIRSAFVPETSGWSFVSADYSQIELRVLAHYCGDPNLCEAFRQDQDIHTRVASQIHGIPISEVTKEQRRAAKTVNFGVLYGQSAYGLAGQLKIPQDEARTFIQTYFMQFPTIPSFMDTVLDHALEHGWVATLFGRRRRIEGVRSVRKGQFNPAERMAVNTVIQGSAADLIKLAMLRVFARLRREQRQSRLLLQIHDELLLECPAEEVGPIQTILEEEMSQAWTLSVPLKVDVEVSTEW